MRYVASRGLVAALTLLALGGCVSWSGQEVTAPAVTAAAAPREALRVLWISSYVPDDRWSLQIRTGIVEALARAGYTRTDGTLEWAAYDLGLARGKPATERALMADGLIDTVMAFGPDVVIVSDDEAATLTASRLSAAGIQVVICGVSDAGETDGRPGTGAVVILEEVLPLQTVTMAQALTAGTGDYLVMADDSESGRIAGGIAYDVLTESRPGGAMPILGIADSWESWQRTVLDRVGEIEFALVVSYQPLPDATGTLVDSVAMMSWMLSELPVPVFSLSNDVVVNGAVGGLVADGYRQGRAAGEVAVAMANGEVGDRAPSHLAQPGGLSRLVLNAAAARHWGLRVPVLFPIASEVYESFPALPGGGL